MTASNVAIVEAASRAYPAQDREAALPLYGDDFTLTSPQDDHIDKGGFFERCFPTVDRTRGQRQLKIIAVYDELVMLYYEYELVAGGTYRNVEAISVRDGLIHDVQVFFGGEV